MTKYININIDYLEDNIIWLEFKGYIDANIALQLLITWLTDVILVMYPVMILLLFQNLPEHSVFELSTYSYLYYMLGSLIEQICNTIHDDWSIDLRHLQNWSTSVHSTVRTSQL